MNRTEFIQIPFIPENPVSLALIDSRYRARLEDALKNKKIEPIFVEPCTDLYPSISCHPDIQCHPLGGNRIVIAPNASESLKNQLIQHNFEIIVGNTRLESNYPNNIAYNVARIGRFAFHNKRYTDPVLMAELQNQGVDFVHVNQGYAKCSVSIIDEQSVITSDIGIARAALKVGLNVLIITPGFIELPGLDYGFIGGATGLLSRRDLGLVGNWHIHTDNRKIEFFLNSRGKTPVTLGKFSFSDIGSIIPLKQHTLCSDLL